jgi:diacylglycerol kinase family enzyme
MIKKKGKHVLDTANVAYTTATEEITLTSEGGPVRVMCDGDSCGVTPLTMKVLPRAVTVLSPQTSPKL